MNKGPKSILTNTLGFLKETDEKAKLFHANGKCSSAWRSVLTADTFRSKICLNIKLLIIMR